MPVVKQEGHDTEHFTMRLNQDGKITFADQRVNELLDLKADELVGRPIWDCVAAADEESVQDAFVQFMAAQEPLQVGFSFTLCTNTSSFGG